MTRQQDTLDARAAADEWASEHGLPPSGGYSGSWYRDSYLGGWWPNGWLKWWAAYGITPGSIIGGDIVAHQYGSVPVDLDVILESEIVTVASDKEPIYKAAIDRAVQRLWLELAKRNLSKKPLREIADELVTALNS